MRSWCVIIGAAVNFLLIAGCATTEQSVSGQLSINFDETQDFSNYKNFTWVHAHPMIAYGEAYPPAAQTEVRIMNAIKATLESKGHQFEDAIEGADFAISFTIGARTETEMQINPLAFYPDWQRLNNGAPNAVDYTKGTLAIDIYDVRKQQQVWHGRGSKRLTRAEMRSEGDNIENAVSAILKEFPPE